MSKQALTDMPYEEFQSLIDGYIDRSSKEYGELPASIFFQLLFERVAQRTKETIEVEGEIINDKLILRLPAGVETSVQV